MEYASLGLSSAFVLFLQWVYVSFLLASSKMADAVELVDLDIEFDEGEQLPTSSENRSERRVCGRY